MKKAAGSDSRLRNTPRSNPINVPMIRRYVKLLGLHSRAFRDGLRDYRERIGSNGPHDTTVYRTLRKGEATPEMEATILNYLREKLQAAYDSGYLTPDKAPMIVRLDVCPEGFLEEDESGS
jgi:hypothetical protein